MLLLLLMLLLVVLLQDWVWTVGDLGSWCSILVAVHWTVLLLYDKAYTTLYYTSPDGVRCCNFRINLCYRCYMCPYSFVYVFCMCVLEVYSCAWWTYVCNLNIYIQTHVYTWRIPRHICTTTHRLMYTYTFSHIDVYKYTCTLVCICTYPYSSVHTHTHASTHIAHTPWQR